MDQNSISRWIDDLRAGRSTAAERMWQRYYERLVGLARQKLRHSPRRVVDEERTARKAANQLKHERRRKRGGPLTARMRKWDA